VTLPVKWTEKFGLKKGDELNIEEAGPTLMVSTEQQIASPKKEISCREAGIFTKNNLSHLYQLGYDEVRLFFDDPITVAEVKRRLPNLIGFELIDQKEKSVLVKSIATTLESEFDTLLKKSFQITNEMAKSLLAVLDKQEFSKLPEIRELEGLNNKFTDICIRILNKKGYKIPQRTMQMYEIVKNIERIADEFKYICDLFNDDVEGKVIDKNVLQSFKEVVEYYLSFYQMFYKFDPELKKKIYLERKELLKKYRGQLEKSKGTDSVFLHHIIRIVEKTYESAGGYFALVL